MPSSISSDEKNGEVSKVDLALDVEQEQEDRRKLERQLVRKLDLRMTMLMVIFVFNYIDRTNVAVARLRGFEADLKLDDSKAQFETVLSIFYAGYILMMVPSNMLLNYLGRPGLYLPACSVVWGIVSICTGFAQNFTGAILCRFFLGVVEAAFLPGALYTLSSWYTHRELGLRNCLLWVGLLVSTAFGQLMASGILDKMEGVGGYRAWKWVFFLEGIITICVTIPAFFILPDLPSSPSSEKWLSPELLKLARLRKQEEIEDLAKLPNVSPRQGFIMAVSDWRVWWLCLCVSAYQVSQGYHQYFPTLVKTLGYNNTITLVLCAPPGFFAAIFTFIVARHSDRVHMRFPHIAFSLGITTIGWIMAMSTMNVAVRYVSIFIMDAIPAGFVVLLAWVSNTITSPPAKKAVAIGIVVAFSQLGSLAASYVFPIRWGPRYLPSLGISIGAAGFTVLMCFILRLHLASENKKAEKAAQENPELRPYKYLL